MLNVGNVKVPLCHGSEPSQLPAGRRGRPGRADAAQPAALRRPPAPSNGSRGKIRNCITIFLVGSPGHLDTWDMKPDAPAEVRGKFKPIATNVPGIQICEHFPLMARMMDKVALIRSLHHKHRRDARERPALDDDRPRLQRRQRQAAHRQRDLARVRPEERTAGQRHPARPDRQHRRRPAARPDGRLPRQRPRAVLPQRRSGPARISRSPTWKCPSDPIGFRLDARQKLLGQLDDLQRRTETQQHRRCTTAPTSGPSACSTSPKAKEAFDLRPRSPTSCATAMAATPSARAA